ncbi:hypothetical protein [Streptomyces sp. NPDC004726]
MSRHLELYSGVQVDAIGAGSPYPAEALTRLRGTTRITPVSHRVVRAGALTTS